MALPTTSLAAVEELNRRYEHWLIRTTDIGRFWAATRETHLPAGCAAVVSADTPHALDQLLAEQERRRGRSSEPEHTSLAPISLSWVDADDDASYRTGDLA
jgi:hypothetical protein